MKYRKMSPLHLHSTPSKFLECKFSSKSGEVLSMGPIYLKIDFRYKILKYQDVRYVLSTSKLTGVGIDIGTIFA